MAWKNRWLRLGRAVAVFALSFWGSISLAASPSSTRAAADEAAQLNQQAEMLTIEGRYDQALLVAERALSTAERAFGPEHPGFAGALRTVATVHLELGEFGAAEPLLVRARSILEKAPGYDAELASVINNLAEVYHQRGVYGPAELSFARSLEILEHAFGKQDLRVAVVLDNWASLDQDRGEYRRAEEKYLRCIEIRRRARLADPQRFATSLTNLATLYQAKGDSNRAKASYQHAIEVMQGLLGPEHPHLAVPLYDLGTLEAELGNFSEAKALYERALSIRERFGPRHPQTASVLNALGRLYDSIGDTAAAEPLFRRSLELLDGSLGPDHPQLAWSLTNLGYLAAEKGDWAEAESSLQRALSIRQAAFGLDHPLVADSLDSLGELYATAGDTARAIQFSSRAADARERSTIRILASGSEAQKRMFLELSSGAGVAAVALAAQAKPGKEEAARVGLTSVLRRKARAVDVMSESIQIVRRQLDAETTKQLDALNAVRSRLALRTLAGPGLEGQDAYRRELGQLSSREQHLESALGTKSASYRARLRAITLEAVQAAIPDGSALVEWTYYRPLPPSLNQSSKAAPARVAAAILGRTGAPVWLDLGEAAAVLAAVQAARQVWAVPTADPKSAARALDAKIFAPIRARLGSTRSLLLAPDGVLSLVPFAALVDEHGEYLIKHWQLSYLTSGRDLLRFEEHLPSRAAPLILGAPEFGDPRPQPATDDAGLPDWFSGRVFLPLPGTADEVQALGAELDRATVLVGDAATESSVKAQHGPAILHLATHGFFVPGELTEARAETPGFGSASGGRAKLPRPSPLLRSGLALAGANARRSGAEDGILTGLEISGLDLDGTALVVLSACETALGDPSFGQGLDGLRRALVLAGSESQLMSLWNVNDQATRDLMVDFYRRLARGERRAEALRRAQLTLLAQPTTAHPSYWAAFVLSGNPGPIESRPAIALEKAAPRHGGCVCAPAARSGPPAKGALVAVIAAHLTLRARRRTSNKQNRMRCGSWLLLGVLLGLSGCPSTSSPAVRFPQGVWLVGGPTRGTATRMPSLAWPPTRWTTMADLGPVQGTLGEAFQRIAEMLKRANLQDSGTFSVDADGFAVVTPVESITETEEPRQDPGRFSYDEAGRIQSGHFLEVLFNRKPGRYRTFTIVVTPLDLTRGAKSRWSEAREHYSEGAAQLPPTLANLNVSPGTRMTILIYEFERPAPDDQEPIFVPRSRISAKDQIVKAGLLPPDALR